MTEQPQSKLSQKMDALVPFHGEEQEKFRRMIARGRGMMSNGKRLSDEQVISLMTFAVIEDLDPFAQECYIMTDRDGNTLGCIAGIAGARRKAREALRGGDYFLEFVEIKDLPAGAEMGFRAILRDTESQANYVKRLGDFARLYKEIGLEPMEAVEQARHDAGNSPTWEAEGYFNTAEKSDYKDSKYSPREKARKRAEAAVLRKRFGLRFSIGDNGDSGAVEVIEGNWTSNVQSKPDEQVLSFRDPEPPASSEAQILGELGY
jgi:hypothetical protein